VRTKARSAAARERASVREGVAEAHERIGSASAVETARLAATTRSLRSKAAIDPSKLPEADDPRGLRARAGARACVRQPCKRQSPRQERSAALAVRACERRRGNGPQTGVKPRSPNRKIRRFTRSCKTLSFLISRRVCAARPVAPGEQRITRRKPIGSDKRSNGHVGPEPPRRGSTRLREQTCEGR